MFYSSFEKYKAKKTYLSMIALFIGGLFLLWSAKIICFLLGERLMK